MHRSLSGFAGLTLIACAVPLARTPPAGTPSPTIQVQAEHTLQPGELMRATIGSGTRYGVVGRVLTVSGDSIVVQPLHAAQPYLVLKSQLTAFQISRGTSTRQSDGGAIGAFAGFVLGYAAGYAQGDSPPDYTNFLSQPLTRQQKGLIGGFAGGAVGALLGAVVGTSMHTDHWETIPLEHLTIIPTNGHAAGWGVKFSFSR